MLPSCPRVLLSCSWFGCAGCGSACRLRTKGKDAACVACLLVAVLAVRAGDDRASFPGAFRAGRACPELRLAALKVGVEGFCLAGEDAREHDEDHEAEHSSNQDGDGHIRLLPGKHGEKTGKFLYKALATRGCSSRCRGSVQ